MIKVYVISFVFWMLVAGAAFFFRKKRKGKFYLTLALILFFLGIAEIASVCGIYLSTGDWLFKQEYNYNAELFEPHPYLVGVPKKNIQKKFNGKTFSHNSSGFRGGEIAPGRAKKRIIALGGSTTYGVGVSDRQTWPFYLDSLLGEEIEVLNFGIPGHSTVEHIIMASFYFSDFHPEMVIVQSGLNDLQSKNIPGLAPDYSDFHAPGLFGALGFCHHNKLPRSGLILAVVLLLEKCGWFPVCSFHLKGTFLSGEISKNSRPLDLYKRNLQNLISVCRANNAEIVFVPQVLVKESCEKNRMSWWIPNTESDSILNYLDEYNKAAKQIAEKNNCFFSENVQKENWTFIDFTDPSHFNAGGNLKLAEILSRDILSLHDSLAPGENVK